MSDRKGMRQMTRGLRRALVGLLLVALVVPALYLGSSLVVRPIPRDYQYSSTVESIPDAGGILAQLGAHMDSAQLGILKGMLGGMAHIPSGKQSTLVTYLEELNKLANNMDEIRSKLHDAQSALASGNRAQALTNLRQLKDLRNQTQLLFKSLPSLLQQVADSYEINTSDQSQKLSDLEAQFKVYSQQIDALNARLVRQTALGETMLWANSSSSEIFVGDTFFIYGALSTVNGTALIGRNLTIAFLTGETTSILTDVAGVFNASIVLPAGTPSGKNDVKVTYNPTGGDAELYSPVSTVVQVSAVYRQSTLTLSMVPTNPHPLDVVAVTGDLKETFERIPLTNRTVIVELDGAFWGNSTTNLLGAFSFNVMIPDTIANGTHRFDVTFPGDTYAPANATLIFDVSLLQSQIRISADRTSLLSGMRLTVSGDVSYSDNRSAAGSVAVYLDDTQYGNVTLGANGTFTSSINVPIFLNFGAHEVRVELIPSSGVQPSSATVGVFVYTTPVIVALIVGVSTASSGGVYLLRRRKRLAMVTAPSELVESVAHRERVVVRPSVEELVRTVESDADHAARVSRCYRLARSLIDSKSGEETRMNETHLEHLARVSDAMPQLRDQMKQLVELFEVAEYSQYPVGPDASKKALELLLNIHEATS